VVPALFCVLGGGRLDRHPRWSR